MCSKQVLFWVYTKNPFFYIYSWGGMAGCKNNRQLKSVQASISFQGQVVSLGWFFRERAGQQRFKMLSSLELITPRLRGLLSCCIDKTVHLLFKVPNIFSLTVFDFGLIFYRVASFFFEISAPKNFIRLRGTPCTDPSRLSQVQDWLFWEGMYLLTLLKIPLVKQH